MLAPAGPLPPTPAVRIALRAAPPSADDDPRGEGWEPSFFHGVVQAYRGPGGFLVGIAPRVSSWRRAEPRWSPRSPLPSARSSPGRRARRSRSRSRSRSGRRGSFISTRRRSSFRRACRCSWPAARGGKDHDRAGAPRGRRRPPGRRRALRPRARARQRGGRRESSPSPATSTSAPPRSRPFPASRRWSARPPRAATSAPSIPGAPTPAATSPASRYGCRRAPSPSSPRIVVTPATTLLPIARADAFGHLLASSASLVVDGAPGRDENLALLAALLGAARCYDLQLGAPGSLASLASGVEALACG